MSAAAPQQQHLHHVLLPKCGSRLNEKLDSTLWRIHVTPTGPSQAPQLLQFEE